jgi:hypothetical protein
MKQALKEGYGRLHWRLKLLAMLAIPAVIAAVAAGATNPLYKL